MALFLFFYYADEMGFRITQSLVAIMTAIYEIPPFFFYVCFFENPFQHHFAVFATLTVMMGKALLIAFK